MGKAFRRVINLSVSVCLINFSFFVQAQHSNEISTESSALTTILPVAATEDELINTLIGIAGWIVLALCFLGISIIIVFNSSHRKRKPMKYFGVIGDPKSKLVSKKAVHGSFVMKSPEAMRRYSKTIDRRR